MNRDEKTLELLARAIAEEIWRRLADGSPRTDDFREADDRARQKVDGAKDDRERPTCRAKGAPPVSGV